MNKTLRIRVPATRETIRNWMYSCAGIYSAIQDYGSGIATVVLTVEDVPEEEVQEIEDLFRGNISHLMIASLEVDYPQKMGGRA